MPGQFVIIMSVTTQQLCDRAEELAVSTAGDANRSVVVDNAVTAFTILPHALRKVIRALSMSGENLDNLSIAHSIEIGVANGYGTLPDALLREYLDQAYLPNDTFASMLPFEDYGRYRFDGNDQLCYFTIKNDKLYYSCDPEGLIRREVATIGDTALQSISFTNAAFSAADNGYRVRIGSTITGIVLDAFIEFVDDPETVYFRGFPVNSFTGQSLTADVLNSERYVTSRSLTNVSIISGSRNVFCVGAAFTSADKGRRLRVKVAGIDKLDAIVESITSATVCIMQARAIATSAVATADIQYSPLVIQSPGIPDIPADPNDPLILSPRVVEDVIVMIAAVMRGDISLAMLIEEEANETQ